MLIAALDEFVQSRIDWRTGLLSDVFLDTVAAALALGLATARRFGRRLSERDR